MTRPEVREGAFSGGLPYLAVGAGEPLVYLCGFTPEHRNPKPGLERTMTLRTTVPFAQADFEVYFTNRWPGMAPGTTFADVASRHADALGEHFGRPVDVLGHSTGGSLALQLIADGRRWYARRWWPVRRTHSARWPGMLSCRCCTPWNAPGGSRQARSSTCWPA